MRHPPEDVLERLLLEPDDVGAEVRRAVLRHLRECAGCRGAVRVLSGFYRDLARVDGTLPVVVEAFLAQLSERPSPRSGTHS